MRPILVGKDGTKYTFTTDPKEVGRVTKGYWVTRGSRLWNLNVTPEEITQTASISWDFAGHLKSYGIKWFKDEVASGNNKLFCRLDEVEEEENEFGIVSP